MAIRDLLESEHDDVAKLSRIAAKFPNDNEVQRLVNGLLAARTERIRLLVELGNYRDTDKAIATPGATPDWLK